MLVMKFGGTSLQDHDRLLKAAALVTRATEPVVVVCSAMGGITDGLLLLARNAESRQTDENERLVEELRSHHLGAALQLTDPGPARDRLAHIVNDLFEELERLLEGVSLLNELSPRTLALISSFGERLSVHLATAALDSIGQRATAMDAREFIRTDDQFGRAAVLMESSREMTRQTLLPLLPRTIPVVTGFIGSTATGITTTLGRGGSDYTASLLGGFIDAREIWIWTDVDGVMTADPRLVPEARVLDKISYREAAEMAYFGSKVIHPSTLTPAAEQQIPIRILNAQRPDQPGTLVSTQPGDPALGVQTVTSISGLAMVTLEGNGMQGIPGILERVFASTTRARISVLMLSQASSEHNISFIVEGREGAPAVQELEREFDLEIQRKRIDPISVVEPVGILAIIGAGMKSTPGISQTFFTALGRSRINVLAIAQGSSELNVSVVVAESDLRRAVGATHSQFGLTRTTHVFLLGKGLIGRTLLKQLLTSSSRLEAEHGISLKVIGVCGRSDLLLETTGLSDDNITAVVGGEDLAALGAVRRPSDRELLERIRTIGHLDLVLVDVTAAETGDLHRSALAAGIHVVTANKKPLSGPMDDYRSIRGQATSQGCSYQFETTFGAGLPVLFTLQDLLATRDKVRKISGCFSGTLGFICSCLQKGQPFSEAVSEAKSLGYTEPDPRDDLSGLDVARKALIIAREVGARMELTDVELEGLCPELMDVRDPGAFMERLPELDDAMDARVKEAAAEGKVLRYVAEISPDKVQVGLRAVEAMSPMGQLDGPDNILVYLTERYSEQPLVIRGPGAGAEVTAAGVFGDLLKIARHV